MLLVIELPEEKAPGARSMTELPDHPLRSSVSMPAESKIVRIGLSFSSKSKMSWTRPVMLES